jgi:hypothetical protein
MMQKRTIYSLLLTSFILVFALSTAYAQTVQIQSKTVLRCDQGYLNITVNNPDDISAFEIILEVQSTTGGAFFDNLLVHWDPDLTVLTNRIVDLTGVNHTSPDTIRIAGMLIDAGDACLMAGDMPFDVAQVEFLTNDVCSGTITFSAATWSYGCTTAQTQFVDCATTELVPAAVTNGVVTIANEEPYIVTPVADTAIHWGDSYIGQIVADDPDLVNSCEQLSYHRVSGPTNLTVNSSTGRITWPTVCGNVGCHTVVVEVRDLCDAVVLDTFNVDVFNIPPWITCPTEPTNIIWGYEASGTVEADDPDSGCTNLYFQCVSFDGPGNCGAVTVDPATGDWSWPTMEDNAYLGDFQLCIKVSDGANTDPCSPENADTCCLTIHVIPTIRVHIEKTHDTYQGRMEWVSIYLDETIDPPDSIGGFDFLLHYDPTALTFMSAVPGQMLTNCNWEYFVYRVGPNGNCGSNACPSGYVRLVAIAETNNGQNHPDCFFSIPAELAQLQFLVTNDRTFECQYIPITFKWYDCGDNAISSRTGDTLFIDRAIYDFEGHLIWDEDDDVMFPEDARLPFVGAPDDCLNPLPNKPDAVRLIDFWEGGIDIICADSIDFRGDVNLNDVPYEIADAVLFSNYFVFGLPVFTVNPEGQIAATDVNADGLTLSVGDLVYLIRVIVGDADPYPKTTVAPVEARYLHTPSGVLSVPDVEMGAAFVVIEGEATPQLLADQMELKYNFDGTNTRILVYSLEGHSFTGNFLNVPGEIVSIEMATAEGNPVMAKQQPTEYALHQNYPNPFNPTTTIKFSVKEQTQYRLVIYNVTGREVASWSGSADPGDHEIVWNAAGNASGIYFYKLEAGAFSDTKKMVLLK